MGVNTVHCFKVVKKRTRNNEMKQKHLLSWERNREVYFLFSTWIKHFLWTKSGSVPEAFTFIAIQRVILDQVWGTWGSCQNTTISPVPALIIHHVAAWSSTWTDKSKRKKYLPVVNGKIFLIMPQQTWMQTKINKRQKMRHTLKL